MPIATKTPEEKQKLVAEVKDLVKTKDMKVGEACETVGISASNYYNWDKKKSKGRKRRKKVVHTTSLVAISPENERSDSGPNSSENNNSRKPDAVQIARLLAEMNATSLRTLFQ
jgi:transposase-like protein